MSAYGSFCVLIYTEHEPESLAETLQALAAQEYPCDKIQVVVLDPDGSDDRREAAKRFGARYIRCSAHNEPSGLDEGLTAADADYIAVVDDDCRPNKQWLLQYEQALSAGNVLAGGPDKVPADAKRFLKYLDYVLTSFAGSAGLRTTGRAGLAYYPRRWNMAFARIPVCEAGGLNGAIAEAWELELANRVREAGHSVAFVSKASVWHQRETNLWGYLSRNVRLAFSRARLPKGKLIYAAPAAAAASFAALAVLSHYFSAVDFLLAGMFEVYAALLLGSGIHASVKLRDPLALAAIPSMILFQHLSHSTGYTAGLAVAGGLNVRHICRHFSSGPCV